jgi:excisionase family DNA binding protein
MTKEIDRASDVWLTRKQLAQHLNLSLRTIDYLTTSGEIPYVNFGRRAKRFHRETIDSLLLKRQVHGKDQ